MQSRNAIELHVLEEKTWEKQGWIELKGARGIVESRDK
jgi:hypothetical protein